MTRSNINVLPLMSWILLTNSRVRNCYLAALPPREGKKDSPTLFDPQAAYCVSLGRTSVTVFVTLTVSVLLASAVAPAW